MSANGKLIVISGPSGVGKGPMIHTLFAYANANEISIKKHVLYTNRPKRRGEIDGITYHFVDMKTLKEKEALAQKKTLEQQETSNPENFVTFPVHEQLQGICVKTLKDELATNEWVLLEIYYKLTPFIKTLCEEQNMIMKSVFIKPLSDEDYDAIGCANDSERKCVTQAVMLTKLINRATEKTYQNALNRAKSAFVEIEKHKGYDYDLVNHYGEDNRALWDLLKEFVSVPGGLDAALKHSLLTGIAGTFQSLLWEILPENQVN